MAPQGLVDVLGANLDKSAASSAMLAICQHQQGRVDDECRRKLQLVVPHMQRAVAIGNVIETHKTTVAALSDTLMGLADAVFLVDCRGRIVFSNAAGLLLLRSASC